MILNSKELGIISIIKHFTVNVKYEKIKKKFSWNWPSGVLKSKKFFILILIHNVLLVNKLKL